MNASEPRAPMARSPGGRDNNARSRGFNLERLATGRPIVLCAHVTVRWPGEHRDVVCLHGPATGRVTPLL